MIKVDGVENIARISRSVVTIGNFDGLHVGHREIISRVIERSKKLEGVSVLLTFQPHPRKVLFPEKNVTQIFDLQDQEKTLLELGLDYFVIQPFSRELSNLKPEKFFSEYILKPLSPKCLIIGYDFAFGANREGSHKVLKELCEAFHVELEIVKPLKVDESVVSSTEIRKCITKGDMGLAMRYLGRPFYIRGVVVKGDQRGRTIGFPTANLKTKAETFPKTGVYATTTKVRGKLFESVTNVGVNPTFSNPNSNLCKIETFIFNFNEDIYGEEISVNFYEFLREEKKFNSVDELKKQIQFDVEKSKEVLKNV